MAIFGFLASLWAVLLSRSSTALLATVPTCGFLWLLIALAAQPEALHAGDPRPASR